MINVNILHLMEGSKKAEGLTVIIDVFRAFSLECYLYHLGVTEIRPVGTIDEAFHLKSLINNSLLIGERNGAMCEGFDFGNSPSSITQDDVKGRTVIHTTSSGTQGIVNATKADEIITGSLVNAKAIAEYIRKKNPEKVSLVCMGNGGIRPAEEDELCAEYLKCLIEEKEFSDLEERIADLQYHGGEHFFRKENRNVFPEDDFWMCTKYNSFPFVVRIEKDSFGYVTRLIWV